MAGAADARRLGATVPRSAVMPATARHRPSNPESIAPVLEDIAFIGILVSAIALAIAIVVLLAAV
jgi:hypothetical protein